MTEPSTSATDPHRKITEAVARQHEAKALILQTAAVAWLFVAVLGTVAACMWIIRCLP